jgi:DNA-binding GntR family transcriptional regulator
MVTPPTGGLASHLGRLPQRHMLADEVYENLKVLIMDHVLAPGARLNIDALARELDTSSTPVRESLARLESDGLATKLPLRGYTVAPLMTRPEFEDLYELRLLVEPWAARRAAERLDDAGAARLAAELAAAPAAPDTAGYESYRRFSSHDARLHDLVLDLAGNQAVRASLARTHAHLHLFRLGYGRRLGLPAAREHEEVVAAILARDGAAARSAMRDHLRAARDRIRLLDGGPAS